MTKEQAKELEASLEALLDWATQHGAGESDPDKRPETREGNPWGKTAVRRACKALAAVRGITQDYTYRKEDAE